MDYRRPRFQPGAFDLEGKVKLKNGIAGHKNRWVTVTSHPSFYEDQFVIS